MIKAGMPRGPKKSNNSKALAIRASDQLHKKLDAHLRQIKRSGIVPNKSDFTRFILDRYSDDAVTDYIDYVRELS